ncbi:glycosyltransferase [Halorubrum sp. AJ67]|nr:glycosyltransferase [Halorubrum sp. AJ67]
MTANVAMILPDSFPPDIRVTKEAHALGEAGHDVRLFCPTEPDRPDRETIDGIDVVRVRTGERTGLDRLRRNLSVALTGYRPEWAAAVAAHGDWIDVIHVHDLLLAGTALRVGDHLDAPVVVDCHENYPEAVRQWRRSDPAWWRSPPDFLRTPRVPGVAVQAVRTPLDEGGRPTAHRGGRGRAALRPRLRRPPDRRDGRRQHGLRRGVRPRDAPGTRRRRGLVRRRLRRVVRPAPRPRNGAPGDRGRRVGTPRSASPPRRRP